MLFLIINGRYLDSILVNIIFYFSNYNKILQQKTSKIFWFFLETNARVLEMRGEFMIKAVFSNEIRWLIVTAVSIWEKERKPFFLFFRYENIVGILNEERGCRMNVKFLRANEIRGQMRYWKRF